MSHYHDPDLPARRNAARLEILQRVNRFKVQFANTLPGFPARGLAVAGVTVPVAVKYDPVLFAGRHIQRAVAIARHHRLVKPETLEAAGFNPKRKR